MHLAFELGQGVELDAVIFGEHQGQHLAAAGVTVLKGLGELRRGELGERRAEPGAVEQLVHRPEQGALPLRQGPGGLLGEGLFGVFDRRLQLSGGGLHGGGADDSKAMRLAARPRLSNST